nr:hypothetical protein [Tanacetum cinerariifolium]
ASTQVSTASTDVAAASLSHDTICMPEFVDDTVTDYSRPTPSIDASKCNKSELQSSNFSAFEHGESTGSIMSKPMIKFVKEVDCYRVIKINNTENARKSTMKYDEMYMNISKGPKVRGNQQNWNNLKFQQRLLWLSLVIRIGFIWLDKIGCEGVIHKGREKRISMAIDGIGWDWSYMANEKENHALVTDDKVPTEFSLMAKSSSSLERDVKIRDNKIEYLKNELEHVKKENESFDNKLIGFENALKDLDNLLGSQRSDKNKEGLGYNAVPPPLLHKSIHLLRKIWLGQHGESSGSIMSKPVIKFVREADCPRVIKTNKTENARAVLLKPDTTPIVVSRPNTNVAQPKMTSFAKTAHSNVKRSFQRKSAVKTQPRIPRVSTVTEKIPTVDLKFFTAKSTLTVDLGNKRKAVKASACGFRDLNKILLNKGNSQNNIDDKRVLVNKSQNKTPYELFNSRTPAIGFLRPFGCHVMILNTLDHLGKFDAKGDEGYFVGYSLSSKSFRVFNKRTKKVEENMHVDVLKNKLIEKGAGPNWLFDIDTLTNSIKYVPVVVAGTSSTNILGTKDVASQAVKKDVSSLRYIALPNWFHKAHLETSNDTIRNSYAQDDSQKEQDYNVDVTVSSRISNPTATLKVLLADQVESAISLIMEYEIPTVSLLVLTVCLDNSPESSSGSRLILKGVFSQEEAPSLGNALTLSNRFEDTFALEVDLSNMETSIPEEGIDYEEVFAPVARIEAIRLFLAYASLMGFIVYQMDVKSAFLYGTIDEEVPRAWYGTLSKYLLDNGFQRGTIDQTLFIRKHKGEFLLVQVYVDDIIFGSSNPQLCREFKALMHDKFQMSTMDVRSANTPKDKENPWGKDGLGKEVELHLYRSMIGSLMYFTASRPDIMFAVCTCARHQVTPKECHLYAVKRIFRYLKGHPKLGLWYPKESFFDLVAYLDSDYGGATQDRKSTTRGCQFLGRKLISWQCKKQTIVSTSTTEAEYVAAASGCGQVLWIQNSMLDYGYNFMNTKIYIDNNSAICIVKNLVYHSKTKHIEIRHHFIRDCYEKKFINVNHIHTDDNVADLLTKPFDVGRFQYLVVSIGMLDP